MNSKQKNEIKLIVDELFPISRIEKQRAFKVWYKGDSNELEQYYLDPKNQSNKVNEDFSNVREYFWNISSKELRFKKTHSGMPNMIINVLNSVIGEPDIFIASEEEDEKFDTIQTARLHEMLEATNFYDTLKQEAQPLTLVVGDGVWIPTINKTLSDDIILEFIDGEYIEFEKMNNMIVGVYIKRYHLHEGKRYLLLEYRSLENKLIGDKRQKNALIQYSLFLLGDDDEPRVRVSLNTIPQTSGLVDVRLNDFDMLLAVPSIFYRDVESGRGKSIFNNKLDLFDDLDQALSQASASIKLSTPVEYTSSSMFERDVDGRPIIPQRYDRRFMVLESDSLFDAGGREKIFTSQPNINVSLYQEQIASLKVDVLSGIISPATLGLDLARNSNALAQREKEKITMTTRSDIVERQMIIISKVCKLILKLDDYLNDREAQEYEVAVNYPEYANPSFDSKLELLSSVLAIGGISPERYVEELWGDSLTEEQKEKEVETIYAFKQGQVVSDNYDIMDLLNFEGDNDLELKEDEDDVEEIIESE